MWRLNMRKRREQSLFVSVPSVFSCLIGLFPRFQRIPRFFYPFSLKSVFIRVHLWFLSSTFVQKNIKKSIDSPLPLCHSDGTHGNINTQNMRTKTLLCAAALAAGVVSSMAQSNVYSLNVVGYVNKPFKNGLYTLVSNPLNGTNNTLNTILPNAPNFSKINLWDTALQDFS